MADWFESWFDSKYYHMLYKNRDEAEAEHFLCRLTDFLKPLPDARILDLACGKGRHSIYLNSLGYDVTGADLSANSIQHASRFSNDRLRFVVHDMRKIMQAQPFDIVLNLFTSFGYFDNLDENLAVLKAVHTSLKDEGIVVIDFLNAVKVEQTLIRSEQKNCDGVLFNIDRDVQNQAVVKTITLDDAGCKHRFSEKVQLLTLSHFEEMFQKTGFTLKAVFGDYNLGTFAPANSDRLILVAVKN